MRSFEYSERSAGQNFNECVCVCVCVCGGGGGGGATGLLFSGAQTLLSTGNSLLVLSHHCKRDLSSNSNPHIQNMGGGGLYQTFPPDVGSMQLNCWKDCQPVVDYTPSLICHRLDHQVQVKIDIAARD